MRFMASAPKGFLVRAGSVSLQPRRGRRAPRWTGSAARHRPEMEGKSGAQACAEFLVVPMAFVRLLPGPDRQEGHSGKEQGTCPAPGGPGLLAEEPGSAARKASPRCSEGSGSADAFTGRGSAALAVLARLLRLLRLLLSADSPVFLFSFSRFSGSGSSSASKMETGKNCLGSFTKLRCCSASSRLRFAGGCAGCEAACSAARVQERGSTSEETLQRYSATRALTTHIGALVVLGAEALNQVGQALAHGHHNARPRGGLGTGREESAAAVLVAGCVLSASFSRLFCAPTLDGGPLAGCLGSPKSQVPTH